MCRMRSEDKRFKRQYERCQNQTHGNLHQHMWPEANMCCMRSRDKRLQRQHEHGQRPTHGSLHTTHAARGEHVLHDIQDKSLKKENMGIARGEPTEFYTQDMRPEANISWIEHKNLSKQKGYERGHGHTRQLVCGCPFFATRVSDSKLFSSYHHRLPQKLDVTSGELVSKGKHDLTDGNNARDQSPFFSR